MATSRNLREAGVPAADEQDKRPGKLRAFGRHSARRRLPGCVLAARRMRWFPFGTHLDAERTQ